MIGLQILGLVLLTLIYLAVWAVTGVVVTDDHKGALTGLKYGAAALVTIVALVVGLGLLVGAIA